MQEGKEFDEELANLWGWQLGKQEEVERPTPLPISSPILCLVSSHLTLSVFTICRWILGCRWPGTGAGCEAIAGSARWGAEDIILHKPIMILSHYNGQILGD